MDRLDAFDLDLMLDSFVSSGVIEESVAMLQEKGVVISRTKAYNLCREVVDQLNHMELGLDSLRVSCSELQIDEMNQPFENSEQIWILTIMDTASRTWLAGHVSRNRDEDASLKTLNRVTKRCLNYSGKKVRCDGHKPHILNIDRIGMIPDSRTKRKDFGWINLIERLHRFARSKALKKHRRFRSLQTLQIIVDLIRHYYNGLKPHSSLGDRTPMQYVSGLRFTRWSDLISYAEAMTPRSKTRRRDSEICRERPGTTSSSLGQTILDGFAQPLQKVVSNWS